MVHRRLRRGGGRRAVPARLRASGRRASGSTRSASRRSSGRATCFSDLRDRGGPFEPPLHFLTVLAALQLPFGFETAARIPSALFGALEVLALILLTREVTHRRTTALVAGLLLAVAPFAVRYSQENRYYVMFSALVPALVVAAAAGAAAADAPGLVWYGAMAAAMQLTHPFAPLVLIVQALRRRVPRRGASAQDRGRRAAAARLRDRGPARRRADPALVRLRRARRGSRALGRQVVRLQPPGRSSRCRSTASCSTRWRSGCSATPAAHAARRAARGRDVRGAAARPRPRSQSSRRSPSAYMLGFVLVLVPLARALGTYFAYRRVESFVPPLLLLVAIAVVAVVDRLVRLHLDRRSRSASASSRSWCSSGSRSPRRSRTTAPRRRTTGRSRGSSATPRPTSPSSIPANADWQRDPPVPELAGRDRQVMFVDPERPRPTAAARAERRPG